MISYTFPLHHLIRSHAWYKAIDADRRLPKFSTTIVVRRIQSQLFIRDRGRNGFDFLPTLCIHNIYLTYNIVSYEQGFGIVTNQKYQSCSRIVVSARRQTRQYQWARKSRKKFQNSDPSLTIWARRKSWEPLEPIIHQKQIVTYSFRISIFSE